MSSAAVSEPPGAVIHSDYAIPTIVEPDVEERGRLKRRRQVSASPRRAPSPSRGHDRNSGSRYRQHHRKHHRPSSPSSSISPPTVTKKKSRRRSDAEPDHTFRGRARNRSGSRCRTTSPILEGTEERLKVFRKRSQPPSRHRIEEEDDCTDLRRQRSYPNLYKVERRDSKSQAFEDVGSAKLVHAQQDGPTFTEQVVS